MADPENATPLTEVVMGLQFDSLPLTGPGLAPFWDSIRDDFPTVAEQPPLLPIAEDFGPPRPPQFSVELTGQPLAPRYWFVGKDETRLLQVQRDRFVYNWRNRPEGDDYPHYEVIRPEFNTYFERFEAFARARLDDTVRCTWAELTYVNLISLPSDGDASSVVTLLRGSGLKSLPPVDDVAATWRFLMRDTQGDPFGRLTVALQQGFNPSDLRPLINLSLTARGLVSSEGQGPGHFLDIAHDWLVRGFSEITSKEHRKLWGLTE
jgi:uncharacterized protein (TIGR04255 family)